MTDVNDIWASSSNEQSYSLKYCKLHRQTNDPADTCAIGCLMVDK